MSSQIIEKLEDSISKAIDLKELRSQINQDITARLKLINYKPNEILGLGILDGSFSVYRLEGISGVNKPYEFEITFVSDDFISIEDIVDTNIELKLTDEINPLVKKSIFGKIFKAEEDSIVSRKHLYKIHVVSPMHYMGLNNRYEIHHDKKTSDIIIEIVNRYASLLNVNIDVKLDLVKAPVREYTTQYNQSDLDFILMLCQEEGYSLIIDYSSNDPYSITLCELNEHANVSSFSSTCNFNHAKEFKASNHIEDFYDKDKPSLEYKTQNGANIISSVEDNQSTSQLRSDIKRNSLRDKLNLLDESYYKDLSRYTQIDSMREYVQSNIINADSQELNIEDCICISLEDERANKQIDTIILEVKYQGFFPNALDEYRQNINDDKKHELQYEVNFKAIPKDIIYKPNVTIVKPRINSIQTAIVSNGDSNTKDFSNTIDVDEQGRIKVLFHFEENRTTSCYLRLSNMHSGDGYGTQFLPRVNQEVIVSFINGDPDLPIITGTIHNGENKNPYNLPNEKTKSFIKTNSMPQYENKIGYNELAFEDKRGNELLSLRAQKDYSLLALNDENIHIQNNSNTIIDNDKNETIGKDSILTVGNDLNENIKFNHISTVEKEKISTIQEDFTQNLNKDFNTIVKDNMKTIVDENLSTSITKVLHEYVEKDVSDKYLENLFIQIGNEMGIDIADGFHLDTKDVKMEASSEINFEGASGISLKCGGNVLTVDGSGIHFKTPSYNANSGNGGVAGTALEQIEVAQPIHSDERVLLSNKWNASKLLNTIGNGSKTEKGVEDK